MDFLVIEPFVLVEVKHFIELDSVPSILMIILILPRFLKVFGLILVFVLFLV